MALDAPREIRPDRKPRKPQRRAGPVTYLATAVVLYIGFLAVSTATKNPNFGWPVVWEYLFHPAILHGLLFAIEMMIVTMIIGSILGTVLAVMRAAANPVVRSAAWLYIWFFRGTPLLVQIIFWFNIAALFPTVGLTIPFGPTLGEMSSNSLITPISAAILALGLNEAAYMAEIIRGGLLGVDEGQRQACRALGMRPRSVLWMILPQAIRIIIPITGNQVINAFKNTSLISVIGVADLLYSAQIIYSENYQTIPLLIVASIWYLAVTSILTYGQSLIERYYGRGYDQRRPAAELALRSEHN